MTSYPWPLNQEKHQSETEKHRLFTDDHHFRMLAEQRKS